MSAKPVSLASSAHSGFSIPKTREDLNKLKVAELRSLASFHSIRVPYGTNKGNLIDLVLNHAMPGTESAQPLFLRRPHKGRRNGTSKTAKRLSEKRAQLLKESNSYTISLPAVKNSVTGWDWAQQVLDLTARRNDLDLTPASGGTAPNDSLELTDLDMAARCGQNDQIRRNLNELEAAGSAGQPLSVPIAVATPMASCQISGLTHSPHAPPLEVVPVITRHVSEENVVLDYSLTLSGGQFYYGQGDLCRPSSLTGLISDPALLYSMWDDTVPTWASKSPLTIRGVPIAIRYWRELYGNFKSKGTIWSDMRQTWSNFKDLMREYGSADDETFRSKWTKGGEITKSHKIIKIIRAQKRKGYKELAEVARSDSGRLFSELFSYRRGSTTKVMKDPISIVKKYEKYQRLKT